MGTPDCDTVYIPVVNGVLRRKESGGVSQTSLEQMLIAFALYMPTTIHTRCTKNLH